MGGTFRANRYTLSLGQVFARILVDFQKNTPFNRLVWQRSGLQCVKSLSPVSKLSSILQ